MSAPTPYVHGTSAPEEARLSALNDLLDPPCLRDLVLAQGLLPADCYDAALVALRDWGERPDAAFWYAVCWAEGARPG